MKRFASVVTASVVCLALVASSFAQKSDKAEGKKGKKKPVAAKEEKTDEKAVSPVLSFTMDSLDGKPVKLSKYDGKVVLIVNVASKCGLTPQYEGLQALHEKYHDKGLAVLGFPANEFGKQEPGSNQEISEFCSKNYGVEFDMFSKVVVKGDGICDLYKLLTSTEKNGKFGGEISWNFEKFLLNRKGEVVARFSPKVSPDSEEVVQAIEAELKKE